MALLDLVLHWGFTIPVWMPKILEGTFVLDAKLLLLKSDILFDHLADATSYFCSFKFYASFYLSLTKRNRNTTKWIDLFQINISSSQERLVPKISYKEENWFWKTLSWRLFIVVNLISSNLSHFHWLPLILPSPNYSFFI